jgi:hypothetical protein
MCGGTLNAFTRRVSYKGKPTKRGLHPSGRQVTGPVVLTVNGYEVTVEISVRTFTIAQASSGTLTVGPAH